MADPQFDALILMLRKQNALLKQQNPALNKMTWKNLLTI
jgi:hypothetical protein